ncbi:hypothetical protein C095_05715 [Fusobacterium necrophorum subsp. funduliforme B35]|uniref:Uncharacterized protein n=1 Tax=Fusobacterium necrophorum subsp. funduliforme B35 TaxID=1226633 RepID=A0A0B4EJP6_9FUSO|nr:hypothetical protein C095_05715 [Fusobacterium necrophorum subsp. funduliforme B35]
MFELIGKVLVILEALEWIVKFIKWLRKIIRRHKGE